MSDETINRIMLIFGLILFVGSLGWSAWDLYRKALERRREHDEQLARIRKEIESDDN